MKQQIRGAARRTMEIDHPKWGARIRKTDERLAQARELYRAYSYSIGTKEHVVKMLHSDRKSFHHTLKDVMTFVGKRGKNQRGPLSRRERLMKRHDAYDPSNPYSRQYLWEPSYTR